MNKLHIFTLAALAAAVAPVATAFQAPTQEKPTTTTIQVKTTKLMRVGSDLVGTPLVNKKNETLGKCEDVVIHPRGDIAFVEFSGAGALKTGTKRYPVPWTALTRNEEGQFVLDAPIDAFPKWRNFEKRPDMSDMEWWHETDKAYAKIVAAKASPTEAPITLAPAKKLFLGSELRARSIENPDGAKVATMHELVLDPRSGRIAYGVLSVGGNLGAGEKMIAVPWEALKPMPDPNNPKIERLTLSTTKEKLEQAPEFQATTEGWQKANEPDYIMKVYEYYSVPPYWVVEKKVETPVKN
jgi:sporulation protein YlmC with PRC-barrel domain